MMKAEGALRLMKKTLNPLVVLLNSRKIAKLLGFPWLKLALGIMFMGVQKSMQMARMAIGFEAFKAGTMEGDNKKGVLPLGQITGIIHDTPSVKDILPRIIKEAEEAYSRLSKKM